jgi:hypothetical protein
MGMIVMTPEAWIAFATLSFTLCGAIFGGYVAYTKQMATINLQLEYFRKELESEREDRKRLAESQHELAQAISKLEGFLSHQYSRKRQPVD